MIGKGTAIIVSVILLLGAGCGGSSKSMSGSEAGGDQVTIALAEQNGSAESGTATLTAEGDRTKVVLELKNKSAMAAAQPQPAHIHKGWCAKLDPTPIYGLTDVKDGTSTTTVDAKLADLRGGAFSINVHESANELDNYVACGQVGSSKSPKPGHDYESVYDY